MKTKQNQDVNNNSPRASTGKGAKMPNSDSDPKVDDNPIVAPSTDELVGAMCAADDELEALFSEDDVAPQTLKILKDNDYYFRTHPDLLKTSVYGYQVDISDDSREK